MDANGTRHHLVLGRDDWFPQPAPCPEGADDTLGPCAEWTALTATVGLTQLPVTFPERKLEEKPRQSDRRGAGRDRFGNWYWIRPDGRGILARAPKDAAPVEFWPHAAAEPAAPAPAEGDFAPVDPPPPAPPPRLQGLAVTGEHYLVAGNLDEPGLLVFDLASGGPPVALRWPAGVPFTPWDIVAVADGGVWVMDRAHARLWSLDRLFRVREKQPSPPLAHDPDFQPATPPPDDGLPDPVREGPVTLDASVSIGSVNDPVAVEVLCDGSALVMGRGADAPTLHRFTLEDGRTWSYALADAIRDHREVQRELADGGHEMAFVPGAGCSRDGMEGQVFVTTPDGNQSFAFTLSGAVNEMEVVLDPRFFPMRRFGGRALVAAAGEAHYDSGDRWVSLLEYPRPYFAREAVLTLPVRAAAPETREPGTGVVRAFDGREPGCVWHRLFIDACIPPESSVTVESRAADALDELAQLPWTPEPLPYLRDHGPELPYRTTYPPGPEGQAGTWELLFQNAVGRYLQLRVTLRGNGRITPRVRALRAYYPRFSYLREYLPAAWREDAGSAWFLDRFLSNVEGTFTEVEDRIADAQLLFGTRTVPAEFLEWLAGWMGTALDASWSERKKRFFLGHAMEMFAGRGTREGLIRALRLALEDCVDPELFGGPMKDGGSMESTAPSLYAAGGAMPKALPAPSASSGGDCGCGCGGSPATKPEGAAGGAYTGRFGVRVVEQFLTREFPGVAFGDTGDLAGPGTTTTALEWTPAQGAEPLHARWRAWLAGVYGDIASLRRAWGGPSAAAGPNAAGPNAEADFASFDDPRLLLPSVAPQNAAKAADWTRFLKEGLGFTWAIPNAQADLALWRDFLARRYRQPADLNRAWGRRPAEAAASFDTLPYPAALPEQRTELADWITFVSVVVPMRRGAHRFTVLVPVVPGEDREAQRRRRDLARRIAMLEKPAHTVVETRLYWAAFRVGEARLGTDTLLGQGSRFSSLVLDRGELAASHLGWTEPWNVRGRMVVGRDPVAASPQTRGTSQRWT